METRFGIHVVGDKVLKLPAQQMAPRVLRHQHVMRVRVLCPKPEIEHGKVFGDKDQFVESENITIECTSGYTVVGRQNITCLENHTWYPEVPKCEWEFPSGCEQVLAGRKLMQCLPRPEDVRMALELYKLSLEIELLERETEKERK
ncbi:apolipoprotein R-like isoform X2 [Phyllostomus hastatus]|uniref:apolipoprotein R-like isoform X2 n=1 Tax=Phyllostomus hastatus TaxID=9423 RepID=UPI001E685942|nr:apolipoprotein R-like isoform X2 [Phyllostomus hastatus]XP_045693596.1 apolipoprotein R-like isoform X2 [Phyllostomus hastatus]XP_045693597.1 apolipoprotein R-like isoform X2 [Phyllostomus hastatus]XP_045693598.1 apolipoprotein R-like isoform X2 [Phyllostomus hastatus]